MNDALAQKIITEDNVKVVKSSITFQDLNFGGDLCLDHEVKVFEELACFRFFFR